MLHGGAIPDVTHDQLHPRVEMRRALRVLPVDVRRQVVESANGVASREERVGEMRTDEAGATRDEDVLRRHEPPLRGVASRAKTRAKDSRDAAARSRFARTERRRAVAIRSAALVPAEAVETRSGRGGELTSRCERPDAGASGSESSRSMRRGHVADSMRFGRRRILLVLHGLRPVPLDSVHFGSMRFGLRRILLVLHGLRPVPLDSIHFDSSSARSARASAATPPAARSRAGRPRCRGLEARLAVWRPLEHVRLGARDLRAAGSDSSELQASRPNQRRLPGSPRAACPAR